MSGTMVGPVRSAGVGAGGDPFVVAYDLGDNEVQELLGELGVELRIDGQPAESCDLLPFAAGIGGGQPVLGFQHPDLLGDLEALGEQMDQGRIHVVDAVPHPTELRRHLLVHTREPSGHVPGEAGEQGAGAHV